MKIRLTQDVLDPEEITQQIRRDTNGAVITFLGTTRNQTRGNRVLYLEYEAYPEMATKQILHILAEVKDRWGIEQATVAHRVGRLDIGEISLVVAIASPHRKEAFAACQYTVDRIKAIAPIWKKEAFENGSAWVGCEELHHAVHS